MATTRFHPYSHDAKLCFGAGVVLILSCLIASELGYRVNSSPSLPRGIWRVVAQNGRVQRGQIISIIPTDNAIFKMARSRSYLSWGLWAGGYSSLLKPVAAVEGDRVAISDQGIAVNGVLIPNSRALTRDTMGRPLKPMEKGFYAVNPGTIWLISSHDRSFDSRYFGPLPSANILGLAKPVLLEEQ
jgi:conjugative transfer signal peptidase TraF